MAPQSPKRKPSFSESVAMAHEKAVDILSSEQKKHKYADGRAKLVARARENAGKAPDNSTVSFIKKALLIGGGAYVAAKVIGKVSDFVKGFFSSKDEAEKKIEKSKSSTFSKIAKLVLGAGAVYTFYRLVKDKIGFSTIAKMFSVGGIMGVVGLFADKIKDGTIEVVGVVKDALIDMAKSLGLPLAFFGLGDAKDKLKKELEGLKGMIKGLKDKKKGDKEKGKDKEKKNPNECMKGVECVLLSEKIADVGGEVKLFAKGVLEYAKNNSFSVTVIGYFGGAQVAKKLLGFGYSMAKGGFKGSISLIKLMAKMSFKHPVISSMSTVALFEYLKDKDPNIKIPKDKENLKKWILLKIKEHKEFFEENGIPVPESVDETVEMIMSGKDSIKNNLNQALSEFNEKFDLAKVVKLDSKEALRNADVRGFESFTLYLEKSGIDKENPLYEKAQGILNKLKSAKAISNEDIESLQKLSAEHPLPNNNFIQIEKNGYFYEFYQVNEFGAKIDGLESFNLCVNPNTEPDEIRKAGVMFKVHKGIRWDLDFNNIQTGVDALIMNARDTLSGAIKAIQSGNAGIMTAGALSYLVYASGEKILLGPVKVVSAVCSDVLSTFSGEWTIEESAYAYGSSLLPVSVASIGGNILTRGKLFPNGIRKEVFKILKYPIPNPIRTYKFIGHDIVRPIISGNFKGLFGNTRIQIKSNILSNFFRLKEKLPIFGSDHGRRLSRLYRSMNEVSAMKFSIKDGKSAGVEGIHDTLRHTDLENLTVRSDQYDDLMKVIKRDIDLTKKFVRIERAAKNLEAVEQARILKLLEEASSNIRKATSIDEFIRASSEIDDMLRGGEFMRSVLKMEEAVSSGVKPIKHLKSNAFEYKGRIFKLESEQLSKIKTSAAHGNFDEKLAAHLDELIAREPAISVGRNGKSIVKIAGENIDPRNVDLSPEAMKKGESQLLKELKNSGKTLPNTDIVDDVGKIKPKAVKAFAKLAHLAGPAMAAAIVYDLFVLPKDQKKDVMIRGSIMLASMWGGIKLFKHGKVGAIAGSVMIVEGLIESLGLAETFGLHDFKLIDAASKKMDELGQHLMRGNYAPLNEFNVKLADIVTHGTMMFQAPAIVKMNMRLAGVITKSCFKRIERFAGKKASKMLGKMLGKQLFKAAGSSVVPVAGWIAAAGMAAWTAYDLKDMHDIISRGMKMNKVLKKRNENKISKMEFIGEKSKSYVRTKLTAALMMGGIDSNLIENMNLENLMLKAESLNPKLLENIINAADYIKVHYDREGLSGYEEYTLNKGKPIDVNIVDAENSVHMGGEDFDVAIKSAPDINFKPFDINYNLEGEDLTNQFKFAMIWTKAGCDWNSLEYKVLNNKEIMLSRSQGVKSRKITRSDEKNTDAKQWKVEGISKTFTLFQAVAMANLMNAVSETEVVQERDGADSRPFEVDGDSVDFDKNWNIIDLTMLKGGSHAQQFLKQAGLSTGLIVDILNKAYSKRLI